MSELVDALGSGPPRFGPDDAAGVARAFFGIEGVARETSGERDQTFQIEDGATRHVLKVSNLAEREASLDFEACLLGHLARHRRDLRVPRVISEDGANGVVRVPAPDAGSEHYARMFEFVAGTPGVAGASLDRGAVVGIGETVADLGLGLRGFFHPGAGRELLWDLARIGELRPLVDRMRRDERGLVAGTIERFRAAALPLWPTLPAQVVHGDLTLENLLFDERGAVCGVIDFGDAHHAPRLVDLASALASMLRQCEGEEALRRIRLFLDGYCRRSPLEPAERAALGPTISARLASIVAIGEWQVEQFPHKGAYLGECVEDSIRLLEELDRLGEEQLARASGAPGRSLPVGELAAKRRRLLGPALSDLFYDEPVHVVRGEGAWLVDADGHRLLDGYNNVAVVGHCHPRVVEAVVDQTRRVNTHTRYLYEPLFELAESLTGGLGPRHGLDTAMILNSGSEANDLMWRLATTFTGARGAIVSVDAYHGMTTAVADLSPQQWPAGYRAGHVETFPVVAGEGSSSPSVAAGVRAAIERLAERRIEPAALVLEGAFTADGVIVPERADLVEAVRLARAAGALIVADEVQAGHGRTGSHLWCFERDGYSPDFVTMGKPMGDGYPVAAMITRAEIVERFGRGTYYFSTFGGNPVAARAALAVLQTIEDEGLVDHVGRVGAKLTGLLGELRGRHPTIRDVRAHGTLVGVQLGATDSVGAATVASLVVEELRRRGVLVGRTGPDYDVLKIRPPLVFDESNAELLADRLDQTLAALPLG
ncbi:MAG: aminotransferase class III-fold pyridoxal phosphate-dependent enzyme [Actinobacteria bacterium]|nr:aminotransferase class III-fold pyridoxal phosphate-dependent enzyme [Actinomycetota bacterium]